MIIIVILLHSTAKPALFPQTHRAPPVHRGLTRTPLLHLKLLQAREHTALMLASTNPLPFLNSKPHSRAAQARAQCTHGPAAHTPPMYVHVCGHAHGVGPSLTSLLDIGVTITGYPAPPVHAGSVSTAHVACLHLAATTQCTAPLRPSSSSSSPTADRQAECHPITSGTITGCHAPPVHAG